MEVLKALNLGAAFLIELAAIAAYGYWGFSLQAHPFIKMLLGVGLPLLVIVLWAFFFAPRAEYRLEMPWLMIGKTVIFGASALCLYFTQASSLSFLFGGTIIVHLLLAMAWDQK